MAAPANNINPQQEAQASRDLKSSQRQDNNNVIDLADGQAQPGITNQANNLQPPDETEAAKQLKKKQDTARIAKKAGGAAQAGGKGIQTAGKGTEAAGKGAQKAGKGVEKAGKGTQKAGKRISAQPMGGASKIAGKGIGSQPKGMGSKIAGKKFGAQQKEKGSKIAGKGVGSPLKGVSTPKKPQLKKGQETAAGRDLGKEKKQSIRSKAKGAKEAVKQVKDVAEQAGQQLTGEALRQSWLNLISSWGLTLIYINIHFLGKYFASSRYFAHFGQEWTAKLAKVQAAPGGGFAVKKINAGLKYVEIIALILLDVLLLILILISLITSILPFLLPFIIIAVVLSKIKIMLGG